jgi:hypothetical protein
MLIWGESSIVDCSLLGYFGVSIGADLGMQLRVVRVPSDRELSKRVRPGNGINIEISFPMFRREIIDGADRQVGILWCRRPRP